MKIADISYRIKIPLAISAVILLTELVVTTMLVTRAFRDARADLETSARNLTTVLARSLREPMVRDDLWHAFEVIRTPLAARATDNPLQSIVVLDASARVFVASDPRRLPVSSALDALPPSLAAIVRQAGEQGQFEFRQAQGREGSELAAARPIVAEDGTRLGTVLVEFDAERYNARVRSTLIDVALISVPGLILLIPLGWYGGKRMAEPLARTAQALSRVGIDDPAAIAAGLPPGSRDEIGRLATQARGMLDQLARKDALEREMVASERLAAVGRVSAAIAHEINNPLGGMLNAIDTAQRHADPDPFTRKTLGLLGRGLQQIRTTVSALLVEARLDSPLLDAQDWQDLHTLVLPQVQARGLALRWQIEPEAAAQVALPAHQIRQLVLNLLLNAIKAADDAGEVELTVTYRATALGIVVANTGAPIAPELLGRLFEPFVAATERDGKRAYGLGLWVCYQITRQLRGSIHAESGDRWTRVTVSLPITVDAAGPLPD
ncbi:MAG: HAMP domain-containing histidine kinase [Burkholderiaceae bacterium]|jgi:signal transduction histidine kinase|nr:HAMP domain-containing histidine kinase [Burkholderiaceae bacterium]